MKIKHTLIFSFCVLLLTCCGSDGDESGDNFDRKAMLTNWANNIIIPAYKNYESQVNDLYDQVDDFTDNPSISRLQSLRSQWKSAYLAWQWVAMFEIGEAETLGLQGYTNTYPTDAAEIEVSISANNYNLDLPSRRNQQGFPAIDYLINGLGSDDEEIVSKFSNVDSGEGYKIYLKDVASRLRAHISDVTSEWETGYKDVFINNDDASATGTVSKLTNDYIFYFEKHLRASKIGIPAGVFSGTPDATDVEAYHTSDFSKELYLEALTASIAFFNGKSFTATSTGDSFKSYLDYLNTINSGENLADAINDQFDRIESVSSSLSSNLSDQVSKNNTLMLNTYDELQVNVINFKVDMLQALNIKVDYVDADGD